ncbi:hypothetical protein [Bacillus massiliigorillae]|uniref:hypothetical protein n=1 Tax=Bacillus massiliigorillae TaxID=1243664 RepID=UPI0005A723B0|nr:hypothetical protein [Bacillus massiliigorillae]
MSYATDYTVRLFEDLQLFRDDHSDIYLKYSEQIELEILRLDKAEQLIGAARKAQVKLCESRLKMIHSNLRKDMSDIQDKI